MKKLIKIQNKTIARSLMVLGAILIASAAPIGAVTKVYADQYDDLINALQAEVNQAQAQADTLRTKAVTLNDTLKRLATEKIAIQNQIELNQAKYEQLQIKIDETTRKIKLNQDALGVIIANLYVDGKITPLEMIAGSKNISDYLDKQEYRNSIRDQLVGTIKTIDAFKAQLDEQQLSVKRTLTDSQNARKALVSKEVEQKKLLDDTKGQEAEYQKLSKDKQAETDKLIQEQIASNMSAAQNSDSQTLVSDVIGGGGYPSKWANAPQDAVVDDWALYNRECVSYVAWKLASVGKFVPYFNGQGNANQWESYVARYGIKSGTTPVVGSAAVLYGGAYGHVMYVESVSSDKSRITVSEYNYGWTGKYSKRSISSAGLTYLYF